MAAAVAAMTRIHAQTISVTQADSYFNPIVKADGTLMTDPFDDEQTGLKQSDFMSYAKGSSVYDSTGKAVTLTSDVPGFMVASGQIQGDTTNTYLMFRFRFQGSSGKTYSGSADLVGLDLNQDGKVDLIFGADSNHQTPQLAFYNPGTGANNSPSTTSTQSYTTSASTTLTNSTFAYAAAPTNYKSSASSTETNTYLTFAITYVNLTQAIRDLGEVNGTDFSRFPTITSTTPMNLLAFSSNQTNALNQDLYGTSVTNGSSTLWTDLGAYSETFTAGGKPKPTPEPATVAQAGLLVVSGAGLFLRRKRRERNG